MSKSLLLIDGTNVAYRWYNNPTLMLDKFATTILSLAKSFKCDAMLVSFDSSKSVFRKNLLDQYKANRNNANKSEEEIAHRTFFYKTVAQLPEILMGHDIPALALKDVETDDVIAYLVYHYSKLVDRIQIVSSDKDMYQLLQFPNVSIYSLTQQKEMTPDLFRETYGIEPNQWIEVKAMAGDTSDNIPGIPLVGETRALSYTKKYGPKFEDVIDALSAKKKLGKIEQNILDSEELVLMYRMVVDLITHLEDILPDDYADILDMIMEDEGVIDE